MFSVVGNKNECGPNRKLVSTENAQSFAASKGIQLFETSAKEDTSGGNV